MSGKPGIASPPQSGRGPSLAPALSKEETLDQQLTAMLNSPNDFSVADYLNMALEDASQESKQSGGDELQQRMAELALQFQLQTQSCHEEIGRIGAELQAILPRCHADVGRVGVGLEGMKQDAALLLEGASSKNEGEEEMSTSLETLSTLHALQSNLSRTKEILTAAATWDSTLSSIAPLLAQQNLTEAVNALAQLENGERALRGMPNPEERHESIAKIRQQVQVMLQPQLKHALQNMNTRLAPLQQCVGLYKKLDKMEALKEEYVKNRPLALHKAWFAYTPSYETTSGSTEGGGTTDAARNQEKISNFLTWLPGWYENVLTLITEERRQSLAIFGSDMVPEVVVKVLRECFRPILPSFQSRLESLYSSNPTGPSKGSLENICAVYEATLQFLALVYENVAGGWIDLMESKNDTTSNGIELYNEMTSIFFQVASPFALYQERLALLETKHSSVAAKLVADDIKQAVGTVSGGSADLSSLQDATDRLKGLTTFVFPLAEGALARFELMNGGFHVEQALASVDGLIAGHAGEIAHAIQSLSSSMTSNEEKLAANFDDQHVLCALEVLKVAGSFRRSMNSFEEKSRERIKVLSERMAMYAKKEKKIEDTLSGAAKTSTDGPFQLPDSMSVVEIDSFLTKSVCGSGDNHLDEDADAATLELLQRLAGVDNAGAEGEGAVVFYGDSDEAIKSLASSCYTFVYDVCSAVPRKQLRSISTMSAWKEEAGAADFASYGTLPQSYITQVGEHMLALVQALEPFASDADALSLANEVMGGVRDVSLQSWREFLASAGSMEKNDEAVKTLMNGKEILEFVISAIPPEEEEEEDEEEDEATKASTAFCNAWLDAVGLSVTGLLLERIMRIPQLTPKGCEHLSADLNYIVNVFSALGLPGHPHPLVSHVAELSMLEGDIFKERMSNWDRSDPTQAALQCIEQRIALMRGVHN